MTLTRWKLLAGVFGISVCGFAALAEPACRTVGNQANRQEPTVPDAKPKGAADAKPKATVPPPSVDLVASEVPAPVPAPVPTTAPAAIPLIPTSGVTTPAELPPTPVALPSLPVPMQAVAPLAEPKVVPAPTPPIPSPIPTYTGPLVTPDQFARDLVPAQKTAPAPIPAPAEFVTPAPAPPQILAPTPNPVPLPNEVIPPTAPAPTPDANAERLREKLKQLEELQLQLEKQKTTSPVAHAEVAPPSAPSSDKKLKVTLQMDEGSPKFEVRDGEEVVLKVVSDKVDVASPTQKGDRWSTLKACGQVKFATPGGDGSCDTLQVVPGTGDVIAIGNVKFRYHWGKVETSASSEKMNFRLGTQTAR